jgi:magnesium transporter
MQKHIALLHENQITGEAIESLRGQELGERITYFYVEDKSGKLVGVVPVRRLLMSPPDRKIADIMDKNVVSIADTASLFEASEILLERRLLAIPIVNNTGNLLGVIDITLFSGGIADLAHKTEIDNVFQLIGVHVSLGRNLSPWFSFRDRFPWLLCNIGGGLICAYIVSRYQSLIDLVTFLIFFIPVVLALSESVGMQSMTLTLQSLAYSGRSPSLMSRFVWREILPAILLGLCSGAVIGIVSFLWKSQVAVSLALGAAIALSIVVSCLIGVIIPGAIKAFRVDPKISSGPIVLAIADICTMLFLFNIAIWIVG